MKSSEKRAVVVFPDVDDDEFYGIRLATLCANLCNKTVRFYCLPFGWKIHRSQEQVNMRFSALNQFELPKIINSHKETSLMGIGTSVSIALLYALKHPEYIASVVAFWGYIQYDKSHFENIPHKGVEYAVRQLNSDMDRYPKKTDLLARKTMIVTPKRDEDVPLQLQHLAGAAETVQMESAWRMLAKVPGIFYHLTQGEQSEITRWLIKGP